MDPFEAWVTRPTGTGGCLRGSVAIILGNLESSFHCGSRGKGHRTGFQFPTPLKRIDDSVDAPVH